MKFALVILLAILVSGCGLVAKKKLDEKLASSQSGDWGVLDTDEARKLGRELAETIWIKTTLLDPDSAKFRFATPEKLAVIVDGTATLVWQSKIYVNAKNRFGGYTGEQPFAFRYRCVPNSKEQCKPLDWARPNEHGTLIWQVR